MNQLFYPFLALFSKWMEPQYNARLRFLEFQIQMLRSRIEADRIVPTIEERKMLIHLGSLFDHDIDKFLHVVVPETYRTWLRKLKKGETYKRSGRSRIAQTIRDLVHRISGENIGWSYRRVCGELKKLGIFLGDTTVRNIMIEDDLGPAFIPREKNPISQWSKFIKANMDSMVACDFFTKKIYTWHGVYRIRVLVFIHLGSRKVYHSYPTSHPTRGWIIQQCRNVSMWLEDEGLDCKYLLRDREVVYPEDSMKAFFKSEGITVIKTPVRSPKANAYVESFIGTYKRECLNHFMCFNVEQLDYINRTWIKYYNTERPHRGKGIDNNVLNVDFRTQSQGRVRCKKELGGLIKSYYREAA
jgi:putative transposase